MPKYDKKKKFNLCNNVVTEASRFHLSLFLLQWHFLSCSNSRWQQRRLSIPYGKLTFSSFFLSSSKTSLVIADDNNVVNPYHLQWHVPLLPSSMTSSLPVVCSTWQEHGLSIPHGSFRFNLSFFHLPLLSSCLSLTKKICHFSLLHFPHLQIHGDNVGQACLGRKFVVAGASLMAGLLLLHFHFSQRGKELWCTHQEVDKSLLCHQWCAPYRLGIWSTVGFSFGLPLDVWKVPIFPSYVKICFSWWILNVLEHGTEC